MNEVAKTVEAYLNRHGTERSRLAVLLDRIDQRTAITSRSTITGHVTCSAILIDPSWRVLHIRHNALDRWLRPGGHLERTDTSLVGAALREVEEETRIPAGDPILLDPLPIDIDVHPIPANPAKNEPDHWHFDLRYAFGLGSAAEVILQEEEVSGATWLAFEEIEPAVIQKKLRVLRSAGSHTHSAC